MLPQLYLEECRSFPYHHIIAFLLWILLDIPGSPHCDEGECLRAYSLASLGLLAKQWLKWSQPTQSTWLLPRRTRMTSYTCLVAHLMPRSTVYIEHTPQCIHFLISSNRDSSFRESWKVGIRWLKSNRPQISTATFTAKEMEPVAVEQ